MFDLPIWIYIGLFAQMLWVLGALIDKYLIGRYFDKEKEGGVGTLILFSSVFSLFVCLLAVIVASDEIVFNSTLSVIGLSIGFFNAGWVLLYLYALESEEVSRVIPLFQTIPIFGFVFGYLLLGEVLTFDQLLSALLIIVGAFILSYHFQSKSFNIKVLLLMIGASILVALQETVFKVVAIDSSFWNSAFWLGAGFSLFGLMLSILVPKFRYQFIGFIKNNNNSIWAFNGLNELIDNSATLIFSFAIILGPIALVQSVNAYQPLIIFLAAIVAQMLLPKYYDEDLRTTTLLQKFLGIVIITAGSIALYFSV